MNGVVLNISRFSITTFGHSRKWGYECQQIIFLFLQAEQCFGQGRKIFYQRNKFLSTISIVDRMSLNAYLVDKKKSLCTYLIRIYG